jgi:hypothetical protein
VSASATDEVPATARQSKVLENIGKCALKLEMTGMIGTPDQKE